MLTNSADIVDMFAALGTSCSIFVACVFAGAAWPKLRKPETMRAALDGVGLQQLGCFPALVRAIPAGELLLAGALVALPGGAGKVAGWVAVAVCVTLLAVVVRAHRTVEDASCSCFGTRQPVTRRTAVRNAALALLALVGAVLGEPTTWSVGTAPAALGAVLLLGVAAVFGWAFAPAAQKPATASRLVPRAKRADELVFQSPEGQLTQLGSLLRGRAGIVVFLGEGEENDEAERHVRSWSRAAAPGVAVVTVDASSRSAPPRAAALVDPGGMGARLAGVTYLPTALLVGRDGFVATEPIDGAGASSVADLLESVAVVLAPASVEPER